MPRETFPANLLCGYNHCFFRLKYAISSASKYMVMLAEIYFERRQCIYLILTRKDASKIRIEPDGVGGVLVSLWKRLSAYN
jgi:hypothetical protein